MYREKTARNNITTKTRRPLATARGIPRLALTALLTLAPAVVLALGAVGVVAPGVASAASASCSPATFQPISEWVWTGSGGLYFVPAAGSGSNAVELPMPSGVTYPASWLSQPVNNPAPLLWLYQNGAKYGLPQSNIADLFSPCQTFTPSLVAQMNTEHFAPAEIGGTNPPGVTTASTTTQSTPPPQTTTPKTGTTTKTTSSNPTPTSTTTTTPAPQYPPVVTTPTATGGSSFASHLKQIQATLTRDQQTVADGPGKTPHKGSRKGSLLPRIIGAVALLVAVIVGAILVGRNKRGRGMTTDEANHKFGGRRDF